MYQNVKLEKGMYHLTGRSFSQALEQADPSAQYAGTELEGLDAFERQLKRFDIHVSGADCDRVEKFFLTTETAVLFPEFVRRAVRRGMEESILPELTAAVSNLNGTVAKGFTVTETDGAYNAVTAEGAVLKKTVITETTSPVTLSKYGRLISASYETVRSQRIDVFTVMLRAVGRKLANAIAGKAVEALCDAAVSVTMAGTSVSYADLTALYAKFSDYNMTAVIASPANAAKILALTEMRDRTLDADGAVRLPFGAKLLKEGTIGDTKILGISKDFALECITGSEVLLETDQLIDCQLDRIAVSVRAGFQPLMSGACAVLTASAS